MGRLVGPGLIVRVLFLDDDATRHQRFRFNHAREWQIVPVWNYVQACVALDEEEPFDAAFLDHDLGLTDDGTADRETTGHDVALYIAAMLPARRPRKIVIHSWNIGGARRMEATLAAAGCVVQIAPFGPLL